MNGNSKALNLIALELKAISEICRELWICDTSFLTAETKQILNELSLNLHPLHYKLLRTSTTTNSVSNRIEAITKPEKLQVPVVQKQEWVLYAPLGDSYLGKNFAAVEKVEALLFCSKSQAEAWYQSQSVKPKTTIIAVRFDCNQLPLFVSESASETS